MRSRLALLLSLAGILVPGIAHAIFTVTIHFDSDTHGSPIAPGTLLNTVYQPWGVTLEKVGPGANCGSGTQVWANNDQPAGFGSAPNVVSTCAPPASSDISENAYGMVHAILDGGASQVSVLARPDGPTDFAVLRGYDAADNLIASATSAPGVTGPLTVGTAGPLIRGVRFSGSGAHFARFDDLTIVFSAHTIDFDRGPNGVVVAAGTAVNTVYSPWGVTFSKSGGSACGPDVYANSNQPAGFGSPPNVVSTCDQGIASDITENTYGMVHATFDQPYPQVCVDVLPDGPSQFAVLRAYDAGDVLLTQAFSAPGVTGTLCVTAVGIRGVRFSGSGNLGARFDNLAVGWANLAGVTPPAAPPTTLALGAAFPNPTRGAFSILCSVEGGATGRAELLDVAGRRIDARDLPPGRTVVRWGDRPLPPGIYLVRLAQGARSVSTRAIVIR